MKLTFAALRAANLARLPEFKNAKGELSHSHPTGADWSPADWMVAVVGELGEAANIMKKMRRGDFGPPMSHEYRMAAIKLQKEFADFITYTDIMALQFGVDLGDAIIEKFNEVSERVKSSIRLDEEGAYKLLHDDGLGPVYRKLSE